MTETISELGVSVVICCYNSAARIQRTLEHIAKQTGLAPREVVLVDNGCTDNTADLVSAIWGDLGDSAPLALVKEEKAGLAYARDTGIRKARYEYVLFCDDDNWLSPDYIQRSYEIMNKDCNIGILGGSSEPVFDVDMPPWFWTYAGCYAVGVQALITSEVTHECNLWGAGMVLRRTPYLRIRGAGAYHRLSDRTGKQVLSGGDSEFCHWFRLAGFKLWYDESLKLWHFIPADRLTKEYLVKYIESNEASAPVLRKYGLVGQAAKVQRVKRLQMWCREVFRSILKRSVDKALLESLNPLPILVFDRETSEISALSKRLAYEMDKKC